MYLVICSWTGATSCHDYSAACLGSTGAGAVEEFIQAMVSFQFRKLQVKSELEEREGRLL